MNYLKKLKLVKEVSAIEEKEINNDLSLRIAEIKNDIKHYKIDTFMLNNRILQFESLKDNISLRI